MSTSMESAHCVCGDENNLMCLRCNQQHKLPFPMPIKDFSKAVDAFIAIHAFCKVSRET